MRLLVLISGRGNSIFRSIRPGRSKAGSRLSILFVARITLTSPLESKPSNWLRSSNIVLWISRSPPEWASYLQMIAMIMIPSRPAIYIIQPLKYSLAHLFVPTASISSMKTIEGERSSATLKSSLTNFGPSPKYFWINSLPTTRKKVADVEFATAWETKIKLII